MVGMKSSNRARNIAIMDSIYFFLVHYVILSRMNCYDAATLLDDDAKGDVKGEWGNWQEWSPCSSTCGTATQHRIRPCKPPTRDGTKELSDLCLGGRRAMFDIRNCTFIECPVDGYWSSWSTYSECSVTCGQGIRTRKRACNNPAPAHGGNPCQGDALQAIGCKRSKPCPIDGGWSEWGMWSQCSVSCGQGISQRIRSCNNPSPQYHGKECEGEESQTTLCKAKIECPVDGKWSSWSEWGPCITTDCDKAQLGFQYRHRTCSNPRPRWKGNMCKGPFYSKGFCATTSVADNCPVDGNWGSWSWCCTKDYVKRTRYCNNPEPKNGGKPCGPENLDVEIVSKDDDEDDDKENKNYNKYCPKPLKLEDLCDQEDWLALMENEQNEEDVAVTQAGNESKNEKVEDEDDYEYPDIDYDNDVQV